MNEVYVAFTLIGFLYVFLAPIGLIIISDYSTHNGFWADYKNAFLVVHTFSLMAVAIVFVVTNLNWAIYVLIEPKT